VRGRLASIQARAAAAADARDAALDQPRAVLLATEVTGDGDTPAARINTQPESDNSVPRGLQIGASWAWRLIVIAVLVWGLAWIGRHLSEVIIPLAVAILLCALLSPLCDSLMSTTMPRGLAVTITVVGGFLVVGGALALIITQIVSQSGTLVTQVSTGLDRMVNFVQTSPLVRRFGFESSQVDQYVDSLQEFVVGSGSTIARYAAEISLSVGHFLAGFAIAIFALFYFLYDGRGIFTFMLKFVPASARERVDYAAHRGWRSLVSYVRATILVALADAVGVLIVALILGVPLAPALAVLVFLGAFVPLVGAFVSGFLAVIVALVALGLVEALIMLGGIIVVMQMEGHILQPFLLGRAVKLHPLAVLIGIAVGVILGGIVGALMSIPLLAFAKTFIQGLARYDLASAHAARPFAAEETVGVSHPGPGDAAPAAAR
jgi:predicted PurR-regulated permease PerM